MESLDVRDESIHSSAARFFMLRRLASKKNEVQENGMGLKSYNCGKGRAC
jgi:hypothetical protein